MQLATNRQIATTVSLPQTEKNPTIIKSSSPFFVWDGIWGGK